MTVTTDDDGELRGWGKAAAFVAVMVPVFVSAFVIGRLTGPDAPGTDHPRSPAGVTSPADGGGDGGGHNDHGLARYGPGFAPPF